MPENISKQGLCFRCEHRAQFFEQGHAPRCECGDIESAKYACYMYRPVMPCVTEPLDLDDIRPRFGPAVISLREKFVRIAGENEVEISAARVEGLQHGIFLYWKPKT